MKCPRCKREMEKGEKFKQFNRGITMNDMFNCFKQFHGFSSPGMVEVVEWRCPLCSMHKREVVECPV